MSRFLYRNLELLEPYEGKLSRTVLRGESSRKGADLPDQQIEKSFAMYIYDYKFPDLSEIAYNHLLKHKEHYKVKPEFYVINFDDPPTLAQVQSHQSQIHGGYFRCLRIRLHDNAQFEQDLDTETG